jgi:hypothetical protein
VSDTHHLAFWGMREDGKATKFLKKDAATDLYEGSTLDRIAQVDA